MKALIVEDELISQCLLAKVLTERGHEVVSFANAEQAIAAWQTEFYPLAIVDAGLPGMSGLQLCRWIRNQPRGDRAYLVAATAPKELADPAEVLAAGVNDFLIKPYDLGLLKVRLALAENQMREFTLRKQAEASLQQSQIDFQRLVETAREGLLDLNPEWRTSFASLQTAEMLGWDPEELIDRPILTLVDESQQTELETLLEDQKRGEIRTELKLRRKDGSICVAFVSGSPTFGADREFKGAVWMLTDLTESLRLRADLALRQDDLEARGAVLRASLAETEQALARQSQERDLLARTLEDSKETAREELSQAKSQLVALQQNLQAENEGRLSLVAKLEAAHAQTRQTETILAKAREDHERLAHQQQDRYAHLDETLKSERDERRRLADQLKRAELELEGRTKQFQEDAARTERNFQSEIGELKRSVENLRAAENELTARARVLAEDLARAEAARRSETDQKQRLADSLTQGRNELQLRTGEQAAALARLQEELKNAASDRKRLEQELESARTELASAAQQRTAELHKAALELETLEADRQRVADELLQLREGLAKRSRDYMTEMVKAGDELKGLIADRNRAEQALSETRTDLGGKLKTSNEELARARQALAETQKERDQLADRLKKGGDSESRVRERSAELGRTREELKTAREEAARASEHLKLESARRQQAEANLEKSRAELDRKLAELAEQLDRARHEASERTRLATLASEESRSQAQAFQALNEELKAQVETQQKLEARCTALAHLAQELGGADQPADVARVIAGTALRLIGWDAFSFDLYSPESDVIQPVLTIDTVNGRAAEVTPFHPGPQPSPMMRRILSSGSQLVLRAGPSNTHTDFLMFGDRARLSASILHVAIRSGNRILGFLGLQSYKANAYGQQELALIEALGAQAGPSLQHLAPANPQAPA